MLAPSVSLMFVPFTAAERRLRVLGPQPAVLGGPGPSITATSRPGAVLLSGGRAGSVFQTLSLQRRTQRSVPAAE